MGDDMTNVTRRKFTVLAAAVLSLMCMAPLPGHAQDMAVRHQQGETEVPSDPKNVLVFDMASLDTLDAIGVKVTGVPSGAKPDYLAKYNSPDYVKIGTMFEPNYEAVNAEEPDLIIVGGRSAAKYQDLSKIAPTIDLTTGTGDFIASSVSNAQTLGRIFGKEAEVRQRVDQLQRSIAELKTTASKAGRGLLVLTTGGKMSAYGPGSRFGAIHTEFGVTPAVEKLDTANHGQAISFEFILETNPDWLFVLDRDAAIGREGQSARQFLDNDIVRRTTAWQKNQVVYLDAANWYLVGGGLQALQRNVDGIETALSGKPSQ
jgi:iron complex transport system substrate-binding protein